MRRCLMPIHVLSHLADEMIHAHVCPFVNLRTTEFPRKGILITPNIAIACLQTQP